MSLAQVKAMVSTILTQIDEQTRLINDFKTNTRDSMDLVQSALQGSQNGYDQIMLAALRRSEDSLDKAQQALNHASQTAKKIIEL